VCTGRLQLIRQSLDTTQRPMTDGDAQIEADIATYGWHVIEVLEDDEGPAFAFTIGLYKRFEHPELVVFGLPLDTMHLMLKCSR
jgi:hypothetical protein